MLCKNNLLRFELQLRHQKSYDNKMNTVAIIQARTGSQRLPSKVFELIAGKPMLEHVVERTSRCQSIDHVIVATTIEKPDQQIADFCEQKGWSCFRGSEQDVLDRYYQAASHYAAQVIVRITSDCPLIDPVWISQVVESVKSADQVIDYSSNINPVRTLPRGLDVEAFTISALRKLWLQFRDPRYREHVTLAIAENPSRFRIQKVCNEADWSHLRWTVDTPSDLELIRNIFEQFPDNHFSWLDVLERYQKFPDWNLINCDITQKVA